MTLAEAVQAVCGWLALNGVTFRLKGAQQLANGFSMAFLVFPHNAVRAFEVHPEECAHCWKVVEIT